MDADLAPIRAELEWAQAKRSAGSLGVSAKTAFSAIGAVLSVLDLHRRCPIYAHQDDCPNTSDEHREEFHIILDEEHFCRDMVEDWTCAECAELQDESDPDYLPAWPCATVRPVIDSWGGQDA